MNSPLEDASIIYLYGSNLDDQVVTELAERLAELPAGIRIITVSYALQPFIHQQAFKVTDQFTVPFEWGEAEVFLQERMSATEVLTIMEPSSSELEHAMD